VSGSSGRLTRYLVDRVRGSVPGRGQAAAGAWLGLSLVVAPPAGAVPGQSVDAAFGAGPLPVRPDAEYGLPAPDTLMTGADVVRAMYERYAGRWYRNLALVQTVRYHSPRDSLGGKSVQSAIDSVRVWYESIQLPGTVRSDIAPLDGGNSQLYLGGAWHIFSGDSLVSARPGVHPVLLLGFDVYMQPVEETLAAVERFEIDPSQVREAEWQGEPAYVVGSADPADDARQFWVDKERLLLRRLLWTTPGGARREVRFDAYEPLGGGWIATELVFLRDGRTEIDERYDYWTIDVEFDPAIFATELRARPGWIRN
jgi:hypothetical protein